MAFYANALNIHPGHLNHLVKKHIGVTAKSTIENRLLLKAQSLLATTAYSIKEIADRLGFSNANYFSAFFVRIAKMSPTAYRIALATTNSPGTS